ncbi:MAG: hypothetical protein KH431_04340 [Erysipelotrichaceae bacterium]|nr:hypothetical protein [Erysipelotrichaceae bacterium]
MADISQELADMFSGAEEEKRSVKKTVAKKKATEGPKQETEKLLILEDVRAVCADKSHSGFTTEVKAILSQSMVQISCPT